MALIELRKTRKVVFMVIVRFPRRLKNTMPDYGQR